LRRQAGLTLIEIAIVFVIIGLLLGAEQDLAVAEIKLMQG